jgi:hypothetical protein
LSRCDKSRLMKIIILLLLSMGCTQKYTGYDLIRKADFEKETYTKPVTLVEVLASGRDELDTCFNQWLFFSNAEKEKNNSISFIVRSLCPGKDFLVQTEMTETWWTTLIFTRACVDMKTLCGEMRRK